MMDEQNQDANSALMELDKGLRAQKVGQQCEAIVRFPGLFERFPFPILINSAFLKLADVFRVGNNFLRLCILRVSQQSNKHLDKILNITEFRRRISVVIHSNDPYARAITLRMLGSIACIISDEKSVHHSIRQGLDSHDRVEQEAAIYATIQFASHSGEFATSICNKIATMLQGLSTPLEIKLKLIPVLQHMHYDVQVSSKSRAVLKDLLPAYPAQDFVVTTLNTLTSLSMHSLVDVPSQVSLLLQYLRCDPREAVKTVTLQNLNMLAKSGPHLWSIEDTNELCKAYSLSAMQSSLKGAILQVLCTLASGNTVLHLNLSDGSDLINLCRKCCYDRDVRQAALASRLLAMLATHATQSDQGSTALQSELLQESADAVESLLFILAPSSDYSSKDKSTLEIVLPAISELCQVCDAEVVTRLIEVVVSLLTLDCQPDGDVASMLCEILASIASKSKKPDLLKKFSSNLIELLSNVVETVDDSSERSSSNLQKVITHICTLLFLSNQSFNEADLGERILDIITDTESAANKWTWYRVARQASRLGEHNLASKLFLKLSSAVASEQYYFWLSALHQFELAESGLLSVSSKTKKDATSLFTPTVLFEASQHYQQGLTALSAAVSPDHPLHFQSRFVKLRCDTLLAYSQLLMTCQQIHLSPPPAIADSSSDQSGMSSNIKDEIVASRCGVLSSQLKHCAGEFIAIANRYGDLHLTSFDADPSTLANIDILQRSCSVLSHAIELLANCRGQETTSIRRVGSFSKDLSIERDNYNTTVLLETFDTIMSKLDKVFRSSASSSSFSNIHADCILQCASLLLSIPISYPRYFYQSLQTTTIKLAISPSQRSPNDPVTVDVCERLALKIEGVIRHGGPGGTTLGEADKATSKSGFGNNGKEKRCAFRHVSEIKLSVRTNQAQQGRQASMNVKLSDSGNFLEETVKPHNDYFSTQFLLSFPALGNHNIIVESSLIDEHGMCWKCGPTESLTVRSLDDSIRVKNLIQQSQGSHK
uniref:integrator complex subunit 7-like n=1 Tax=Styela clava TaxID=7725 RepID=UPI00193A1FC8|nr:integrator complex subunit 7-like [Styela clava]